MPEIVDRAKQIRDVVEKNPGITGKELAAQIGLTPGRVSQITGPMSESGDLKRKRNERGTGLHLGDKALRRRYITRRWK